MMKTRLFAAGAVVLAVACLLLWMRRGAGPRQGARLTQTAPPSEQAPMELPETTFPQGKRPSPTARSASATPVPDMTPAERSNMVFQAFLADWQAPIDFYGMVLDESSNRIDGASIRFSWNETPSDGGERTAMTETDAEGLFSLRGKRGASLEVWVSKEGYYGSRGGYRAFNYAHGPDKLSPDAQSPVVFLLHKKGRGEPLIHVAGTGLHSMRDFLLAPDGTPTEVSLRDGRLAQAGQGDLKVEFHAGPRLEDFPSRIAWQCRVTTVGGGMIETSEGFPFLAPETGYEQFDQWSVNATNWTEVVSKRYYVKLRDGNFGRVELRVIGVPGRAYFRMESFLNPSGSRILESESDGR